MNFWVQKDKRLAEIDSDADTMFEVFDFALATH
jgi:hypothetical protein